MTKKEFLAGLRQRLGGYPQDELTRSIGYWSEMIEDRIEDGATEEEAVASLGDIEEIAIQIEMELPLKTLIMHSGKDEKKEKKVSAAANVWLIILAVIGSPIWLPIGIMLLAIVLMLIICVWAIDLCLWACTASGALGFLAGIFSFIYLLCTGYGGISVTFLGAGLASLGFGTLLGMGALYMAKGVIAIFKAIVMSIKKSIVGRKGNK